MNIKVKNISLKAILIIIALGIWVLVLQNAGIIHKDKNVYIIGGYIDDIDNISRTVSVSGDVDVNNTVSVSIDEVLGSDGKKHYYNNSHDNYNNYYYW